MIPWLKLIQHTPQILSLARELRQRMERAAPSAAASATDDVQTLAADLRRQADVLHAMAAQMETLTTAAVSLRRSMFLAISIGAVAFLLGAAALIVAIVN